jgi:polysaccharide export outer membrane protein
MGMKCNARRGVLYGLIVVFAAGSSFGQSQSGSRSDQAVPGGAPQGQSADAAARKVQNSDYVIGDGDVLAINVWKEPDLTKAIPVRFDGKISLPLIGEVQAGGRTPGQLEGDITEKLKSFINSPVVSVLVQEVNSKKFNILGEVAKPGSYSVAVAPTVMDAIAAAGGFRDFAKKSGVYVLRTGPDGHQTRLNFNYKEFVKGKNPEQNVKLEANDSIIVP